ncbi:uncharacterized protein KQ657_002824 [Scheffersomyces spartinae]|uniref:Protein kinase domain-containing protein n=1 Tax=Scheffersomyces spartinae TaxID=45513 RepID=A0A9P7V5E2_9ASCO|nr:uncharacterized protein KQ657_002824 [Scheffersomyces spartinae]KAG7191688.1 hypothetical protein KQ657_002824 [Scheffersomyces spartinae]
MSTYVQYEADGTLLINRYKFLTTIQEGSFGKVSLALDLEAPSYSSASKANNDEAKVAIKAMYKNSNGAIARHEIAILKRLGNHKNVCRLLNHFETDEFICLVLEYCGNGDLYDLIHQSPSLVDLLSLARDLKSALDYIHSKGVYHRDVKPENILFDNEGTLKLCDWGLATKVRYSKDWDVGTERYMAPECRRRGQQTSAKEGGSLSLRDDCEDKDLPNHYDCKYVDYWSMGITLLATFFGYCPFKPTSNSKSLQLDNNYKQYVHFQNYEVLYDIYPNMNVTCFETFICLLDVHPEKRQLDSFISMLSDGSKFGLTVDEEFELEHGYPLATAMGFAASSSNINGDTGAIGSSATFCDDATLSGPIGVLVHEDSLVQDVFNMDHDDLIESKNVREVSSSTASINSRIASGSGGNIHVNGSSASKLAKLVPGTTQLLNSWNSWAVTSLMGSSVFSKSWCDYDDDDDCESEIALLQDFEFVKSDSLFVLEVQSKSSTKLSSFKSVSKLPSILNKDTYKADTSTLTTITSITGTTTTTDGVPFEIVGDEILDDNNIYARLNLLSLSDSKVMITSAKESRKELRTIIETEVYNDSHSIGSPPDTKRLVPWL